MALVDVSRKVKPWNQYIQPTQRISSGASAVNKLTIVRDKLCYNGKECNNVVPAEEAIESFAAYLHENFPEGVELIAHNGARFDFPLLKRDLMKSFQFYNKSYPIRCIDSIKVFKTQFPGLDAYNQPYLLQRFLGSENVSRAHEAVGDCINLRNAIETAAKEKNMSLKEFLSIPSKPLIDDEELKKESRKTPKTRTIKRRKLITGERTKDKKDKTTPEQAGKYNLRQR